MENVSVGLQAPTISCLELTQFRRLVTGVRREMFVDEEIPNFLAALPCVESFVLGITHPAEFFVGSRRLRPVALTDQLDNALALINLLTQQSAKIAAFGSKDVLPDRLVSEKRQRICHQMPGTMKLTTDGRNED